MEASAADLASDSLRWAPERRLEFVDFRLYWEGRVNRADLIREFGISVPQASVDLARYQELAPGNMLYDKSAKTYVAAAHYRPHFLKPEADGYLNSLRSISDGIVTAEETWVGRLPQFEALPLPRRNANPQDLRAILAAIRGTLSLRVLYQSMSGPEPAWRWISPHALAFDGFRWHVRSFCHKDENFKDFVLPRILEVGDVGPAAGSPRGDRLWQTKVTLRIVPHPRLSPGQRRAIELDYGMTNGVAELNVRAALVYYARKHLGLDRGAEARQPHDQQIVLENVQEVDTSMRLLEAPAVQ